MCDAEKASSFRLQPPKSSTECLVQFLRDLSIDPHLPILGRCALIADLDALESSYHTEDRSYHSSDPLLDAIRSLRDRLSAAVEVG